MAIDGPSPLSSADAPRVPGVPTVNRGATPAPLDGANQTRFTPTDDLARFLSTVRQTPEVRQELIGEIARRLNAGELQTRAATEQVVEGLLESQALEG